MSNHSISSEIENSTRKLVALENRKNRLMHQALWTMLGGVTIFLMLDLIGVFTHTRWLLLFSWGFFLGVWVVYLLTLRLQSRARQAWLDQMMAEHAAGRDASIEQLRALLADIDHSEEPS